MRVAILLVVLVACASTQRADRHRASAPTIEYVRTTVAHPPLEDALLHQLALEAQLAVIEAPLDRACAKARSSRIDYLVVMRDQPSDIEVAFYEPDHCRRIDALSERWTEAADASAWIAEILPAKLGHPE